MFRFVLAILLLVFSRICLPAALAFQASSEDSSSPAGEDPAAKAFDDKQFLRAYVLVPDRYPELTGVDGPSVSITSAWRTRTGTPGTEHLHGISTVLDITVPRATDVFALRFNAMTLNAGRAEPDTEIGGSGARTLLPTTFVNAVEPMFLWRRENSFMPHLEIGATPANGSVAPTLQGKLGGQVGTDFKLSGDLYRTSVTDSILSLTGIVDPVGGKPFGRVVESGVTLTAAKSFRENWDVDVTGSWGVRTGRRVQSNRHTAAEATIAYELHPPGFDAFSVGAVYAFDHYARDLSGFLLGEGGYYSPLAIHHIGIEFEFWTKEQHRWILHASASPGWQRERTEDETLPPGLGVGGSMEAVYRLVGHWSLGAVFNVEKSLEFRDFYAGLGLRYDVKPRKAMLTTDVPAPPFR
jgi:Cellulose synthase operon protein C C-terminus (BCSC_C)